jgi:coiled-coil domain-containing protein 130
MISEKKGILTLFFFVYFQGGLNKFHGQHALRERARKLDQGILIIRYELWPCLKFSFLLHRGKFLTDGLALAFVTLVVL